MAFLPVPQHRIVFINRARSAHNSREKQLYIFLATLVATYIGQCSTWLVQNLMKTQLYTYLGSEGLLVLPLSVAEFDGLCTQFEEKQLCTSVAYYGLQTLRQTSETLPSSVTEFNEVCTQF